MKLGLKETSLRARAKTNSMLADAEPSPLGVLHDLCIAPLFLRQCALQARRLGSLIDRFVSAQALTLLALTVVIAGACSDDNTAVCASGATQVCVCVGAGQGVQRCADDGSKWEACDCKGTDGGTNPKPDTQVTVDQGTPVDQNISRDSTQAHDQTSPVDVKPTCGSGLGVPCCSGGLCQAGLKCNPFSPKVCKVLAGYTGCTKPLDCVPSGNSSSTGLTCSTAGLCCFTTGSAGCKKNSECCDSKAICKVYTSTYALCEIR